MESHETFLAIVSYLLLLDEPSSPEKMIRWDLVPFRDPALRGEEVVDDEIGLLRANQHAKWYSGGTNGWRALMPLE